MKRLLILLFFAWVCGAAGMAQEGAGFIRRGNKEFQAGKYYDSELEYRKALEVDGASPKAQFNLGGALYKQEKYDEALGSYKELAGREGVSDEVRASALYNLGNALYQQKQYAQRVASYKEALRLNPGAKDIKYNLSAALRMLQQQQNQQDKQQDQKNQDQQNKDQQKQDQQNKDQQQNQDKNQQQDQQNKDQQQNQDKNQQQGQDQQGQNQEQKDQQQKDQQQKDQGSNQEQQGKQDSKQSPQQGKQDGKSQPQKGASMSQEDAAQLLKALENQENALQAKVQKAKAKARARAKTDKDW